MPTYGYICENCGHEFEQLQSITAKPIRKCPKCAKARLKRLIGCGAGIIFKGSGFYQTDYRDKSYKEAAKKDSPQETKKESKDSKPADKTKKSSDKKTV